jgi:hypothetical protein
VLPVLPAVPALDVLPPELLQAVAAMATTAIAAADATLTRLAGSQLLRDSTLSPPIDGPVLLMGPGLAGDDAPAIRSVRLANIWSFVVVSM